ncbi:MAG: sulfatase-like hydrolase/transferase, partial [Planctomycetota bacterium]
MGIIHFYNLLLRETDPVRRWFSALFFVLIAIRFCDASPPPNFVVILADDLGWNSVGFHNDEFKTPHIDSIAAEGMELDRFYVAPMCSPTRAGFMTGRYPIRFGCARAVIPPQRDFGLPL